MQNSLLFIFYWQVKDLLQLMIDSAVEDGKNPQNDQIAGFSVEFLLGGYETTSTTLSYTSYLLAMNTHIQEKLQAEIDKYFKEYPVNVYCCTAMTLYSYSVLVQYI